MTVIVNGEEKQLSMIEESGVDSAADFVGNAGFVGEGRDAEGRIIMSESDYRWWQGVIADHQRLAVEIKAAEQRYGYNAVESALDGAFDRDLEDQPASARLALRSLSK